MRILIALLIVAYLFISLSADGSDSRIKVIKNPEITHKEKKFVKPELIYTIPADFSQKNFFARPRKAFLTTKGELIVFDDILVKFFVFDKNFKFLRSFGETGQGPGELSKDLSLKLIEINKNDEIIVSDEMLRRYVVLNTYGKCVRMHKFPEEADMIFPFPQNSMLIAYNMYERLVHVDEKLKIKKELANDRINRSVLYHLPKNPYGHFYSPSIKNKEAVKNSFDVGKLIISLRPLNLTANIVGDGNFCFYLHSSSRFIHLDSSGRVINEFSVVPEGAAEVFRKLIKRIPERFLVLFPYCFIDSKTSTFLLGAVRCENMDLIYTFDINGNLLNTLKMPEKTRLIGYSGGYIFCRKEDGVVIYKEKK